MTSVRLSASLSVLQARPLRVTVSQMLVALYASAMSANAALRSVSVTRSFPNSVVTSLRETYGAIMPKRGSGASLEYEEDPSGATTMAAPSV